jgi:hypothetical protein
MLTPRTFAPFNAKFPQGGFEVVPEAGDNAGDELWRPSAKGHCVRRLGFLAASSFALVTLFVLAALGMHEMHAQTQRASTGRENILLSEEENRSEEPRELVQGDIWFNVTATTTTGIPTTKTTTTTMTMTTTTTTTTIPAEMQWLITKGALFGQCCKVLKNYGVVPGVDWGSVTIPLQEFWLKNKCDDVIDSGEQFNETLCDQAAHVSQCCQVAIDYNVVPGKDFGWAPETIQQWWDTNNCDAVTGTKDNYKSDMCHRVASEIASEEGGKTIGMCLPRFVAPEKPTWALQHNGVALQDTCFSGEGPFHAFIIGDWGGMYGKSGLEAAKHLSHRFERGQGFVYQIDVHPQLLVRDQMKYRAEHSKPDYILNVGDNFYWAGVEDWCGAGDISIPYSNGGTGVDKVNQFQEFYEKIYNGPGLDGKQWLGILGNHDYGGWLFNHAWDQMIGYTWSTQSTGRWMTPSLYWRSTVRYPTFSVDYYFLDTNVWDALDPHNYSPHNICSLQHQGGQSNCPGGLNSVWTCPGWFKDLWKKQKDWLAEVVPTSTADWRIVVTHFPPYFGMWDWKWMAKQHQFDLIVTGHRHSQFTRTVNDKSTLIWPDWGANAFKAGYTDFLDPVSWVVSGGGGGVTSEHAPDVNGWDDQYGFMDLTLTKEELIVEAITHSGKLRRKMVIGHVFNHTSTTSTSTTSSTQTISTTTTTTTTTSTTYDMLTWIEWKVRGPL